jgi:hypothetical protein
MAGICPQIDADWQGGRMTVADRTMAWAVFFSFIFHRRLRVHLKWKKGDTNSLVRFGIIF